MSKPVVVVILGQTATGKSSLAVKIAKKFNGEIISADSRQIYKGLDIGTGKITPDTKNYSNFSTGREKKKYIFTHKGIPHYLIDVASPKKQFTVAEYQKKAIYAMAEIVRRGKVPIICGGTGFYIDAVTKGMVLPEVPPNKKLRKQLLRNDAIALFYKLQELDPERAKNIDPKNKVRLIRAIEIVRAIGKVPKTTEATPPYEFVKIGLKIPEKTLKRKIKLRLRKRLRGGMAIELYNLRRQGVSWKRFLALGFDQKYVALYLQKKITNKKMLENLFKGNWHYAKRQTTWFKRDKKIKWFDASRNSTRHVLTYLKKVL